MEALPLVGKGFVCIVSVTCFWNPASMVASPRCVLLNRSGRIFHPTSWKLIPTGCIPPTEAADIAPVRKAAFHMIWAETPRLWPQKWYKCGLKARQLGRAFLLCCRLHHTKLLFSNIFQGSAIYEVTIGIVETNTWKYQVFWRLATLKFYPVCLLSITEVLLPPQALITYLNSTLWILGTVR